MSALLVIIALIGYALFYLPIYLPVLLRFLFRSPRYRVMRIMLRVMPVFAIFILAAQPHSVRPDFGDDVAGSFRGADYYWQHEFWPDVAWTWGAGISCLLVAVALGFLASFRHGRYERVIESA